MLADDLHRPLAPFCFQARVARAVEFGLRA
jgi:hypothetical protein